MLQPAGSIIELCHVVTDMTSAIRYWTRVVGAGPFFVGDMEFADGYRYRGRPCGLSLQIAFGFSGGLIVELVRPIDTRIPSVFSETLDSTGPGYHHVMIREDYDKGFERLGTAGYEPAFQGALPGGERFVLFDTRRDSGGFVELMDISPLIQRQLDNMARAHHEWDGISEPVRSMASSFA
jgi:hypothetical protein